MDNLIDRFYAKFKFNLSLHQNANWSDRENVTQVHTETLYIPMKTKHIFTH